MAADICLVASPGGHIELLLAVAEAYRNHSHVYVVPASVRADELVATGHCAAAITNPHRNPLRLPRNVAEAIRILWRERPRLVISSGAGLAAPLCLIAKATGRKLIFIETMARIDHGSATGRLLYRVADGFLVQWPELLQVYPRAELCQPPLLAGSVTRSSDDRQRAGTFVAVGNHTQPFDRLLVLVADAIAAGHLPRPVLAQVGASSYRSELFETVETLPPQEISRALWASEVVVTHGGAGLISTALRAGRRPLVLARRSDQGEHVDDHQVAMTAKLTSLGLAVSLDQHGIADALRLASEPLEPVSFPGPPLAHRLHELVESHLS